MMSVSGSEIEKLAPLLGHLPVQREARPRYDMLSDALIWSDEWPLDRPPRDWWAIRPLLHYRASIILSEPAPYQLLWDIGLKYFPLWPGFLAERRSQEPELVQILQRGRRGLF